VTRKRLWEIGAAVALLLAVGVVAAGFLYQWERQRRLDAELVALLTASQNISRSERAQILSLIRQGASVHRRGEGGWTVLMEAAAANDLVLLREALARGADVNATGDAGGTALMVAAWNGRLASVQLLVEHGADVLQKDIDGDTALSIARQVKNFSLVRLLQQHGARE
jgi:ankyrin repeat protein